MILLYSEYFYDFLYNNAQAINEMNNDRITEESINRFGKSTSDGIFYIKNNYINLFKYILNRFIDDDHEKILINYENIKYLFYGKDKKLSEDLLQNIINENNPWEYYYKCISSNVNSLKNREEVAREISCNKRSYLGYKLNFYSENQYKPLKELMGLCFNEEILKYFEFSKVQSLSTDFDKIDDYSISSEIAKYGDDYEEITFLTCCEYVKNILNFIKDIQYIFISFTLFFERKYIDVSEKLFETLEDINLVFKKVKAMWQNIELSSFNMKDDEYEIIYNIGVTWAKVYEDFEQELLNNVLISFNTLNYCQNNEDKIYKVLEEIVLNKYFEFYEDSKVEKERVKLLISKTLLTLYKNKEITFEDIIGFYSEKVITFVEEWCDNTSFYKEKSKYMNEKERILSGDLSKEKTFISEKFNFEKVSNGFEFEKYVGELYKKMGYKVIVTKQSCDQGADIVIEKDEQKTVVQTKFYTNPVGNKAVQEIVGAIALYKAQKGIVVTNSTYTKSAIELAFANNIKLVDKTILNNMIKEIQDL